jgi:hypothetical protein
MTFVEVYSVSRSRLREACLSYPHDAIAVRKATVRLAFRAGVQYICRTQRAARMLQTLGGSPPSELRYLFSKTDDASFSNESVDEKLQVLMRLVEKQSEKLEAIEALSLTTSPMIRTPPPFRPSTVLKM